MSKSPYRSFARITNHDLKKLGNIARADFTDLFARSRYSRPYRPRLRLICLCQGTATVAWVYARDNEQVARQAKVLTIDEARRVASNIARLPELFGAKREE